MALVASLVSPILPAEANGPHAVIADLACGLGTRGHEVTVYAAAGSSLPGAGVRQVPVEPEARGASVSFGRAAAPSSVAALNRAYARLFAELRHDEPDAVSQHAFDAAAIDLAEGLPVLHTLHLPPMVDDVVAALRHSAAPRVTVSQAARLAWERAGVSPVGVLRNGVPVGDPSPGSVLPVALVAGRISPEKGTDAAIRVARRAGLAVLVAGDVYDDGYFTRAVEPMLRPGEWIGPVPRAELFELMARSAVLLMPVCWDEAFGLVAAEAQMAGCPVVGYRRGALPEVVRHGIGGWLVEPDDEEALVAAVACARGLDRALIRERARAELGVERMVDDYERLLAEIAATPPDPPTMRR
ncbi:MAG TPA: glycosyltransferase [Candidatus Limnocylindria bacterium]|nr:glycosyltransferase [Candidatus Limnocylindria bacterium]